MLTTWLVLALLAQTPAPSKAKPAKGPRAAKVKKAAPPRDPNAMYQFEDRDGSVRFVQGLANVPEWARAKAEPLGDENYGTIDSTDRVENQGAIDSMEKRLAREEEEAQKKKAPADGGS
jgi:hypothetical protein